MKVKDNAWDIFIKSSMGIHIEDPNLAWNLKESEELEFKFDNNLVEEFLKKPNEEINLIKLEDYLPSMIKPGYYIHPKTAELLTLSEINTKEDEFIYN